MAPRVLLDCCLTLNLKLILILWVWASEAGVLSLRCRSGLILYLNLYLIKTEAGGICTRTENMFRFQDQEGLDCRDTDTVIVRYFSNSHVSHSRLNLIIFTSVMVVVGSKPKSPGTSTSQIRD